MELSPLAAFLWSTGNAHAQAACLWLSFALPSQSHATVLVLLVGEPVLVEHCSSWVSLTGNCLRMGWIPANSKGSCSICVGCSLLSYHLEDHRDCNRWNWLTLLGLFICLGWLFVIWETLGVLVEMTLSTFLLKENSILPQITELCSGKRSGHLVFTFSF